jgi:hypothetical protein
MKPSSHRATWLVLGIAIGACAQKRPQSAMPSTEAAAAPDFAGDAVAHEPEDVEEWEQELARLEDELRASGVTLASDALRQRDDAAPGADSEHAQEASDDDSVARCGRICELAEATCELHDKICALADEHAGEQRYAAACTRADDHCRRASEACRGCSA